MARNEMDYSGNDVDISIDARVEKKLENKVKNQQPKCCGLNNGFPRESHLINACIYNSEED